MEDKNYDREYVRVPARIERGDEEHLKTLVVVDGTDDRANGMLNTVIDGNNNREKGKMIEDINGSDYRRFVRIK